MAPEAKLLVKKTFSKANNFIPNRFMTNILGVSRLPKPKDIFANFCTGKYEELVALDKTSQSNNIKLKKKNSKVVKFRDCKQVATQPSRGVLSYFSIRIQKQL